jgi:hypothetical protein
MQPAVFLLALLSTVGIAAFTVIKVAGLFAARRGALPSDVVERLEELENDVQGLRQELASAQERLDFAERLLSSTRDDRR